MPLPLLSVFTSPEYGSISAFVKREALVLISLSRFSLSGSGILSGFLVVL
jgi:hypothetical protein